MPTRKCLGTKKNTLYSKIVILGLSINVRKYRQKIQICTCMYMCLHVFACLLRWDTARRYARVIVGPIPRVKGPTHPHQSNWAINLTQDMFMV